jgi:hypothetical protein
MDSFLIWLIKNPLLRAQVLAVVRHVVTVVGTAAIAKGYADHSMVEDFSGFATAAVGFWLSYQDTLGVDKKIQAAKLEVPPIVEVKDDHQDNIPKDTPEHLISSQIKLNKQNHPFGDIP